MNKSLGFGEGEAGPLGEPGLVRELVTSTGSRAPPARAAPGSPGGGSRRGRERVVREPGCLTGSWTPQEAGGPGLHGSDGSGGGKGWGRLHR